MQQKKPTARKAQIDRSRKIIQVRAKIESNRSKITALQLQTKGLRAQLKTM